MLTRRTGWCALLLAACGGEPQVIEPAFESDLRYDTVWQIATHNSYWVDRGVEGDLAASGVQQRLLDQLLVDHARALEIDVHRDPANPRQFLVFHTKPGNSTCATLADCLAALRVLQRALPEHEVVSVVIELKELFASIFDDTHTVSDLDSVLERELGDLVYRPRDLLTRCPGETTLAGCVERRAWPPIEQLRGRFLVAVLGNWDMIGGRATRDWVSYATSGPIDQRVAFPMASSWKLDYENLTLEEQALITPAELAAAKQQSALLQIEDLADPVAPPLLAAHGVIRVDGAFSPDDQARRVAASMQLLQTDTPWRQYDDRGLAQPLRPLFAPDVSLVEPGNRLLLSSQTEGVRAFAFVETSSSRWEMLTLSGLDARRIGCLRAQSETNDSVEACRLKQAALAIDGSPLASGTPDAERAHVRIETCQAGACSKLDYTDPADGAAWGDLLALSIDGACAVPLVARDVRLDGSIDWQELPSFCAGSALTRQGISRPPDGGGAPSVFFGVTRDGIDVSASDLSLDGGELE